MINFNRLHYIFTIGLIVVLSLFVYGIIVNNKQIDQVQWDLSKTSFKRLAHNAVRADTQQLDEKQLIKLIKDNNPELYDLIKKAKEKPISHIKVVSNLSTQTVINKPSDSITETSVEKWVIREGNGVVPVAWVQYNINSKLWNYRVIQNFIKLNIITTELKSGEWNTYIEGWLIPDKNDHPKDLEVKPIKLEIQEAKVRVNKYIVNPESKFQWWNPKFGLGASIGLWKEDSFMVGPALQLSTSLMSYGISKNDTKWRFLELVLLGSDSKVGLGFSPASFRFTNSNLFANTYLRPLAVSYQVDWSSNEGRQDKRSIRFDTGISVSF